jgi:hypothetical protein
MVEDRGRNAQVLWRLVTEDVARLAEIRIFEVGFVGPSPAARVAMAGMGAPARLFAAAAPQLQQISIRTRRQQVTLPVRKREPLLSRQPTGISSLEHAVGFLCWGTFVIARSDSDEAIQ